MSDFLSSLLKAALFLTLLPIQLAYGSSTPSADGETPPSLACIYGLTPPVPGCPISTTTAVPTGGSGVIAVIEGSDDPNAFTELQTFSAQWGLKQLLQCTGSNAPCIQTYYAATCLPASNPLAGTAPPLSTDLEPEIDFEWAHAMAPYASIYIVEANSFDIGDLQQGLSCANSLLAGTGGIISISKSYSEFPEELAFDSNFQTPGIIYISSSGDYLAPARYPASSPNVIAAGGTMIQRDKLGNYIGQSAWVNTEIPCTEPPCRTGGTGGPSRYEPRPSYQNSVQKVVGTMRGTPDISFAAQSVDIFCCLLTNSHGKTNQCDTTSSSCPTGGSWVKTGGTSLASPALAGIINSAHSGATSTFQELSIIYNGALKNYHTYWTDITLGHNGYPAMPGYDFTTGLGVPRGYKGK